MKEILQANVLSAYAEEFEQEGLALQVDPPVLDAIVARALKRETGARGLRAALATQLEDAAYAHFGSGASARVILSLDGDEISSRLE